MLNMLSLEKCKLKPHNKTIIHLLEWLKLKKKKAKCSEDVEQLELSHIAGGNAQWCSHVNKEFGRFFFKLNIY